MSRDIRLFQAGAFEINQSLCLDERGSHYLARVLRSACGDSVTVFNGKGGEYFSRITSIDKKKVVVCIEHYLPIERESLLSIYQGQGITRGEKMDMILQKSVELGVTHFTPLITERSNVKLDLEREAKRMAHWQGIIISACEQSGRNRLPVLSSPMNFAAWLSALNVQQKYIFCPHASMHFRLSDHQLNSCAIAIGPEGGFTEQEIAMSLKHDFLAYQLGERILRTETASLAVLAILQHQHGKNQSPFL